MINTFSLSTIYKGFYDMTNNNYWGYHLTFSAINLDKEKIMDKAFISNFSNELISLIKMKPMIDPVVIYCPTQDVDKQGFTLFQIIETSNLSAHFLNDGSVMFDVFSCMYFDDKLVKEFFIEQFSPSDSNAKIVQSKMLKRTFKESIWNKLKNRLTIFN